MKISSVLSFAAAISLAIGSTAYGAIEPTSFTGHVTFTASGYSGTETLENFPMLVKLSESISGFLYSECPQNTIRFVDAEGNILAHEVDTWNTSGTSFIWVKVPSLSGQATSVRMYYGKDGSSVTASTESVWSAAGFKSVWHLNMAGSSTSDSVASYAASVINKNDYCGGRSGIVGGDYWCEDNMDATHGLETTAVAGFAVETANVATYSAWVRQVGGTASAAQPDAENYPKIKWASTYGNCGAIWNSKNGGTSNGVGIELCYEGKAALYKQLVIRDYVSTTGNVDNPESLYDKAWHYIVMRNDGTNRQIWIDGVVQSKFTSAQKYGNPTGTVCMGGRTPSSATKPNKDCVWTGDLDEMRFRAVCSSDDWLTAEYANVSSYNTFVTAVQAPEDTTAPTFVGATATVADDGSVTITATFDDNLPAEGSVKAVIGGTEYAMSTTDTTLPAVYTATIPGLPANQTQNYSISFSSTGGSAASRSVEAPFYTGVISVARAADAEEVSLTPGSFTVSRADAGSALRVNYTVGGTATAGSDYETLSGSVTIPAGASSAVIEVMPKVNAETEEDVTVQVTLTAGAYLVADASKTAELTVVNASVNPYLQFVSPTGNDENDGYTLPTAKATIAAAVAAVMIPTDGNAEVIVAPGAYVQSSTLLINKAVTVRSSTGAPEDVTISKTANNISLIKLNFATACLKDLTVSGGYGDGNNPVYGANVNIDSEGGVIDHCILNNGVVSKYGCGGGNLYMKAGVVTRCVIRNGVSNYSAGGGGVWMSGGQVESSLIYGNVAGSEQAATYYGDCGGGVHLTGATAKLVNCTLYANRGGSRPGVRIDKGSVYNCVIVDNKTMCGDWDFYNVGGEAASASGFVNCMTDAAIAQPNETCFGAPFGFADRTGADYHITAASLGVDAGAEVTLYSNLDLDGNPRVSGGAIDVGCYELQQSTPVLAAGVSDEEILVDEEVTFTAGAVGGEITGDVTWDFGDGETATGASVTHAFETSGLKTVTVSATVGGQPVSTVAANLVKVCEKDIYVNETGSSTVPYDTVEKGASNFATAFAEATDGTTIHVTNGVYLTTSQTILNKAITIEGIGDDVASVVITNRLSTRIFYVSHKDAVIRNLTIAGGKTIQQAGANVYILGQGGTVSNCVLSAGLGDNYSGTGGNLSLESANGLVTHCVITKGKVNNNGGGNKGANVNMTAGRLAHSLIVEGSDSGTAKDLSVAGGVRITGGTMEFCTIANNTCQQTGGIYASGGTIANCIIAGNTSTVAGGDAAGVKMGSSAPTFVNCYTDMSERLNEECFTATASELIMDIGNGKYEAAIGSPSIDKGLVEDETTLPATDLAGNARVLGARVDIGCYEYVPPAFAVSFVADVETGITPATITFTATTEGGDEGDVMSYAWDFDGDNVVDETTSTASVEHTYTVGGTYTVGLAVTDSTAGLSGSCTRENYIKVAPKVIYVDGACEDTSEPYATWETAASNLFDAVDFAIGGCEIVVRSGTYAFPSTLHIEKPLYIHSETENPETVVLKAKAIKYTVLDVNSSGAWISGVTMADAKGAAAPGGLNFGDGGGVVSNCVIRDCQAYDWSGSGGAVYFNGPGLLTHSVISNCTATTFMGGGTKYVVDIGQGRFENNLVIANYSSGGTDDAGRNNNCAALMTAGSTAVVRNNTFVGNQITGRGLLSVTAGATLVNNVFADNAFLTESSQTPDGSSCVGFNFGDSAAVEGVPAFVNCATDLATPINDTCVNGTAETFFKDYANGALQPAMNGPLYKAGIKYEGLAAVDLAGKPRKEGNRIDIGCYESKPSPLLIILR